MHLRPYRTEDWPTVCQIYDLSKPDELGGLVNPASIASLSVDEKMQSLFYGSQIVVMEDGDRVVGFCGNRQNFITWLFVHPEFRHRGIASALIGEMLASLSGPITLNVMAKNLAARAVYEKIGFKVERTFQGSFQGTACEVARLRHTDAVGTGITPRPRTDPYVRSYRIRLLPRVQTIRRHRNSARRMRHGLNSCS